MFFSKGIKGYIVGVVLVKTATSSLSDKDSFAVHLLFWLHLPVVILYFGLLFVPLSAWPEKVVFHFWVFVIIVGAEVLWGLYMRRNSRKMDIVCPLTSWMQFLRGYRLSDVRNYGHSYIAELLGVFGFRVRYSVVNYFMMGAGAIILIEYLVFA